MERFILEKNVKLKNILQEIQSNNLVYHLSLKSNLSKIKRNGLLANTPSDMEDEERGVYLFKTRDEAEDALMNWYGDRFDEDEEFILLTIDSSNLTLSPTTAGFELISHKDIPPKNILSIENV